MNAEMDEPPNGIGTMPEMLPILITSPLLQAAMYGITTLCIRITANTLVWNVASDRGSVMSDNADGIQKREYAPASSTETSRMGPYVERGSVISFWKVLKMECVPTQGTPLWEEIVIRS